MRFALIVAAILFLAPGHASAQCNSPHNTIMNQNNGQDGIMFNITAQTDVYIDSFWTNFEAGTIQEVEIWVKNGTFVGSQNNAGAWTLIDSVINLPSGGVNNFTKIPIHVNYFIPNGQTVGFYVTRAYLPNTGPYMRYTNGPGGSTGGQLYNQNSDIQVSYANGKDYPFATSFNPRIFNGRIFYHCCPPPPTPQLTSAPTQICASDTFTYSVAPYAFASSYTWSPGASGTIVGANADSSTVQIAFNGSVVNDTICITMTDTCTTSDTCVAVVVNPPIADAGPDESICATSYQLQGNNGVGSWSVIYGAGTFADANQYNTTVSGLAPGVNTLRWSVGNQTCDTVFDEVNITVKPIPVAGFNLNDGCDLSMINFQDNSYALGGNIIGWDWDVNGDNTSDYSTNQFNHTYGSGSGDYICTLVVTANLGCMDTIVDTVTVFPNPQVAFTYDPDCEGSPMAFTDNTAIASGTLTDWSWAFGDGSSNSAAQNPAHIYPMDGMYEVTLTVTSDKGCSISSSDSVEVFSIPDVSFSVPDKCQNDSVFFTDNSVSTQGTINYWEWNFGDASPSVYSQHTGYLYNTHGTYNAQLTVATDKGCTNTVVEPVDIYPIPVADFERVGLCEKQTMRFEDLTTVPGDFSSVIVNWEWDFGDGNEASGNPTAGNFYQDPGYFDLSITPYTNHGCHVTYTREILVRPRPEAKSLIMNDRVCAGNEIWFRDESFFDYTYDTIGVTSWKWDFGDGTGSLVEHPKHVFTKGGDYNTLMVVETEYGCVDSMYRTAVVYHNPEALFRPDSLEGCSPYCITYIDESFVADGADLMYSWTFGDGNGGTEVNPSHCYSVADGLDYEDFTARLTVTTPNGCKGAYTSEEPVRIHSNPIASFELEADVYNLLDPAVAVTNTSQGGDFWLWSFGDGNTSEMRDPMQYEYQEPGSYTITLYTETDFGCIDQVSGKVLIEPHQTLYIPKSFTPNYDGRNDYFEIYGEDLEYVRLWVYDRWGNELFYGEDDNARWDGLHPDGRSLPIGSYTYVVEYKQTNRIKQKLYGNFVLSKAKTN